MVRWYFGGKVANSNSVLAASSLDNSRSAFPKFLCFVLRGPCAVAKRVSHNVSKALMWSWMVSSSRYLQLVTFERTIPRSDIILFS